MGIRRVSKQIDVGGVKVGGIAPITVQSMTKTDTRDVTSTVNQICELQEVGCEIVRCAVPDMDAALALKDIKKQIKIPLIADIHFHYELALKALESGVDCLRLNPGNIRDTKKVQSIVVAARERQVPIRIGVNFGSLPPVCAIGIAGGRSLVPLIIFFGLGSEKEAAAAGATFICVNSLVGFIARFKSGNFDPDFILPLIGFVAIGGFLGSYYGSKKYNTKTIQKVMGGIIIVAIILLTRKIL